MHSGHNLALSKGSMDSQFAHNLLFFWTFILAEKIWSKWFLFIRTKTKLHSGKKRRTSSRDGWLNCHHSWIFSILREMLYWSHGTLNQGNGQMKFDVIGGSLEVLSNFRDWTFDLDPEALSGSSPWSLKWWILGEKIQTGVIELFQTARLWRLIESNGNNTRSIHFLYKGFFPSSEYRWTIKEMY